MGLWGFFPCHSKPYAVLAGLLEESRIFVVSQICQTAYKLNWWAMVLSFNTIYNYFRIVIVDLFCYGIKEWDDVLPSVLEEEHVILTLLLSGGG